MGRHLVSQPGCADRPRVSCARHPNAGTEQTGSSEGVCRGEPAHPEHFSLRATQYSDDVRAMKAGASKFLTKPFGCQEFLTAITPGSRPRLRSIGAAGGRLRLTRSL